MTGLQLLQSVQSEIQSKWESPLYQWHHGLGTFLSKQSEEIKKSSKKENKW